ncbi:MAG: DUF4397 domain-containing protein, partial [Bacteroidales bacterium]|nr:DUF4397 domain-containing protein [Bacteroidales bacterium]
MKTKMMTLAAAIALAVTSSAYGAARVQVIHNSSDPDAKTVDVWLNDVLLIDDFNFRTATPFIDAPAGTPFTITITPPDHISPANPIWFNKYILEEGKTYVLVANGMFSSNATEPNPPFGLYVYDMGREAAAEQGNTDVLVFHGSDDAPVVDVVESGVGAGTIIDNMEYGMFKGYLELPAIDYVLDIRDRSGSVTVKSYKAPFSTLGLQGQSITVVASGFLSQSGSGIPGFGLFVALPSGGKLLPLFGYQEQNARVQVIHNSADKAAASVDIWLNGALLLDDFAFRTATPFIDAPAGTPFTISVQPSNSTGPQNALWSNKYILEAGKTYILIANGIVSGSGYQPDQPFDIYVYDMGREQAATLNQSGSDVLVFHGSTDAPVVDVFESGAGAGTIVNDLEYGTYAGYLELPTADYVLDIKDQTGINTLASYSAPLATLGLQDGALAVVASGFLNPANNSDGASFGLWVALPSGGDLIPLPTLTDQTARVQVIHNSADLAAET